VWRRLGGNRCFVSTLRGLRPRGSRVRNGHSDGTDGTPDVFRLTRIVTEHRWPSPGDTHLFPFLLLPELDFSVLLGLRALGFV
jgi:hypothetical protein